MPIAGPSAAFSDLPNPCELCNCSDPGPPSSPPAPLLIPTAGAPLNSSGGAPAARLSPPSPPSTPLAASSLAATVVTLRAHRRMSRHSSGRQNASWLGGFLPRIARCAPNVDVTDQLHRNSIKFLSLRLQSAPATCDHPRRDAPRPRATCVIPPEAPTMGFPTRHPFPLVQVRDLAGPSRDKPARICISSEHIRANKHRVPTSYLRTQLTSTHRRHTDNPTCSRRPDIASPPRYSTPSSSNVTGQ